MAKLILLTPERVAALLNLPVEDAAVLVGSGRRVAACELAEFENREGPIDLSFRWCGFFTGHDSRTFGRWRKRGLLRVRVTSGSRRDPLLVPPAELVRCLRSVAAKYGGATTFAETPAQSRRRGERDRAEALAACRGGRR